MAGKGKKTFVAGEVLLAQDVNDYLMDQSVMNFASSAARSSAIPTPTEGMTTYVSDRNQIESYDGANWISTSGLTYIDTLSFTSVSSVSFPNDVFTSDYDNYRLVLYLDGVNSGGQNIALRLRAAGTDNTSSNYQYQRHGIVNSVNFVDVPATTTSFNTVIASNPLSTASLQFDIIAPKLTRKTIVQGLSLQTQSTLLFNIHYAGQMTVTTAYDSLTLFASASTITGVARLYGYRN
jgi:hypothetical protein